MCMGDGGPIYDNRANRVRSFEGWVRDILGQWKYHGSIVEPAQMDEKNKTLRFKFYREWRTEDSPVELTFYWKRTKTYD